MARQPINIGSSANDGTGDYIRPAFDKVNDNFTELYEAGFAGLIAAGTPLDNQLAVWSINETIAGDANLTWDGTTLTVTGNITVTGDLIANPTITAVATSRALALTDAGDILEINTAGGAVVVTIPTNATVAFPIGTIINLSLIDITAAATVTAAGGVTLNGVVAGSGIITATAFNGITLYKKATDEWVVQGAIAAVA